MDVIQFYSVFILYVSHISASNLLGIIPIPPCIANYQYNPYCLISECCNKDYIKFDRFRLEKNLTEQVYGQPLLSWVVNALSSHFNYPDYKTKKPLTISFHGMTGTGKNYVSNFIADSLFKKGSKSQFVQHFIGRKDFAATEYASQYIQNLYHWLKGNITECRTRLFIFDEVDKMIPEVLNAIKPLLDYNDEGADYSEAVFIFLTNTGARIINEHYHDLYVREGKQREEMEITDFETLIKNEAFNSKGGFWHNDLISHNLIDHYIPFLPLEEKHIIKCIKKEFKLRKVDSPAKKHIDEVMKFIEWGPDESKLFSKTGCKRLGPKVGLMVDKFYKHAKFSSEVPEKEL